MLCFVLFPYLHDPVLTRVRARRQMSDRNSSMTDNTPLRRIQAALADLKKEVSERSMRFTNRLCAHASASAACVI